MLVKTILRQFWKFWSLFKSHQALFELDSCKVCYSTMERKFVQVRKKNSQSLLYDNGRGSYWKEFGKVTRSSVQPTFVDLKKSSRRPPPLVFWIYSGKTNFFASDIQERLKCFLRYEKEKCFTDLKSWVAETSSCITHACQGFLLISIEKNLPWMYCKKRLSIRFTFRLEKNILNYKKALLLYKWSSDFSKKRSERGRPNLELRTKQSTDSSKKMSEVFISEIKLHQFV